MASALRLLPRPQDGPGKTKGGWGVSLRLTESAVLPPTKKAQGIFLASANSINNQKTINPMARGGKRPGAGCPRGSAKKKANIKAAIIAASSLSPLDVMRDAMATFVAQGKLADAVDVAKAMAPYIHPKVRWPISKPARIRRRTSCLGSAATAMTDRGSAKRKSPATPPIAPARAQTRAMTWRP
jgi:hypothetical protein